MNPFPVNFEALAQQGGNPASGGYPYTIKGSDLMRDFVFAALDTEDALVETVTGQGGYPQRRLKIPAPPSSGTHVLGAINGTIQWIATEECA
jgi:hypothetical protein